MEEIICVAAAAIYCRQFSSISEEMYPVSRSGRQPTIIHFIAFPKAVGSGSPHPIAVGAGSPSNCISRSCDKPDPLAVGAGILLCCRSHRSCRILYPVAVGAGNPHHCNVAGFQHSLDYRISVAVGAGSHEGHSDYEGHDDASEMPKEANEVPEEASEKPKKTDGFVDEDMVVAILASSNASYVCGFNCYLEAVGPALFLRPTVR